MHPACSDLGPLARYRPADDLPLALLPFQFGIENLCRAILYRRLVKMAGIVGGLAFYIFAVNNLRELRAAFSRL